MALSKNTGGARLIGLTPSIYRLWARLRYWDCAAIMECRIKRPFLAAAPGGGAGRAAFDAARLSEAAHASRRCTASTFVDISQYYEHINVLEHTSTARDFGVPIEILALTSHQYVGPRFIRVQRAMSKPLDPRVSIIAGCTWATALIRILVIPEAERYLELVRKGILGWYLDFHLSILWAT